MSQGQLRTALRLVLKPYKRNKWNRVLLLLILLQVAQWENVADDELAVRFTATLPPAASQYSRIVSLLVKVNIPYKGLQE
jgi:hypothetical protein